MNQYKLNFIIFNKLKDPEKQHHISDPFNIWEVQVTK